MASAIHAAYPHWQMFRAQMFLGWLLTAVVVLVFLFFTRHGGSGRGFKWRRRREMTHAEKLRSVTRGPFADSDPQPKGKSPGEEK